MSIKINFSLSSKIVFLLINITLINCLTEPVKSQSALDNHVSKYGYRAAYRICQAFITSRIRNDCLTVIGESNFLDINAVSLCESLFWVSERTINCFRYITDKIYISNELQACANFTYEYNVYECLDRLGSNTTKDDFKNIAGIYNTENAYNNAYQICQSFTSSNTKNNCYEIVENSNFIDINAVNLCKAKFSVSTKIVNCLSNIVDKVYSNIEINNCSKKVSKKATIECLSTSGYVGDYSN